MAADVIATAGYADDLDESRPTSEVDGYFKLSFESVSYLLMFILHCIPTQGDTKLMAVSLSILN